MKGWISLHRELTEHWLYPENREFTELEAWIDILLQVNHKERKTLIKGKLLTCKRGESIRSIKEWANRWGWSKSKVYRFFEILESDKMIETVSETVTTRLSVCNYEKWQNERNAPETDTERRRNASETQADTNNNVNNYNNVNNTREGAKREYSATELQALDLCEFLVDSITEWDTGHRYSHNKPNIESNSWMKEVERLIRIDGKEPEGIRNLIAYTFTQSTESAQFWAPNVQSGKSLRKHYDKIRTQYTKELNGIDKQQSASDFAKDLEQLEQLSTI